MTSDDRVTGPAGHRAGDGCRTRGTDGGRTSAGDPSGDELPETRPDGTVLAAGCVLWRRTADGGIELALVHRPKWQDWSHPKGKLKPGEDAQRAALREVLEETGMTCEPGRELPTSHYQVEGRPKEVRYWAAEATGGHFAPNSEVDRLLWLAPAAARDTLTRNCDSELVDSLLAAPHTSQDRTHRTDDAP